MTSKSKFRPSPALVIACVALFMALAGSAVAAKVASVRSAQIVDGTVRTLDLRDNAVSSPKIANATITADDLGTDSVGSEEIAKDAVKSDEIAKDAVNTDEIAENAVTSTEVAPDSLTAGDLAANSVTSSEVADESLTANDLATNSVGSSELQASSVRASELASIVTVSNSTTINSGNNASVSVDCPAGTTVISGGNTAGDYRVALTGALRSGNGWVAHAHSYAPNSTSLTVFAYCLAG